MPDSTSTFRWFVVPQKRVSLHPLGVRDSMNCQSEMIQTNAHHPYPQPKDADLHYPSDIRTYTWSETNSFDIWFAVKMDISNCFELFFILQMFFRTIQKKRSLDGKRSRCLSTDRCPSPNREKISIYKYIICKLIHVTQVRFQPWFWWVSPGMGLPVAALPSDRLMS